jgi:hypothetical protein
MKNELAAATAVFLSIGTAASAHRLDEYLQATMISVEKNRIYLEMRLTPGIAVLPEVLPEIDTNSDGVISEAEQRAYVGQVVRDLSLSVDGDPLTLHEQSFAFPAMEEIKEGLGEIQLQLDADLPHNRANHRLIFENHHDWRIGAYLVNCLVPHDPEIRIIAQNRNYSQSFYQLDFADLLPGVGRPTGTVAFLLLACLALVWRSRYRSSSTSLPGCEQQIRASPSAGGSSGSGR